ncbi:DUF6670 family protein [Acinetobacter ihumii]|uniref:DUF6670 family protein n=1 Tax=Acinetobacter ihumii TaxID=2483802 RepID=UPI00102FF42E|nr:DUF6670 family protein [Acinetobacter ihumii]
MNIFSLPKLSPRAELFAKTLHHLAPLINQSNSFSRQIFQQDAIIQPYVDHPFYSCSRYGFNFPNLIAPCHYLNISATFGMTGLLCYDSPLLHQHSPRQHANVFISTGLNNEPLLQHYGLVGDEVIQTPDKILFGRELLIEGNYPEFQIKGHYDHIEFQLQINVGRQASWLMKSPVYDHFSLMMHYQGHFNLQGEQIEVAGMGSFEFARAATPHLLIEQPLSLIDKIPVNFMTYQIMNLDDQTQLILHKVDIAGKPMNYKAYIRHKSGLCDVFDDVEFQVTDYLDKPTMSRLGEYTLLPKTFEWKIFDHSADLFLEIQAEVKTEYQFGLGLGYVAAFEFKILNDEHMHSGQGYMEYIDIVEQTEICPYSEAETTELNTRHSALTV